MVRALVLNATFEPLCVVPERRAVVLVLNEKAELVHHSGRELHSEHLTVQVPSVVRLRYFVKVPFHRRLPLNRRAVFARDGGRCQYCSGPAESIDHVVPRSRGGLHVWENVVASCRPCNVRKRDRLLEETSMTLRREPAAPRHLTWMSLVVGAIPTAWEPYLQAPATLSA